MTEQERKLLGDILVLMNGAVFPGKGRRANELGSAANKVLGEDVYKIRSIAGDAHIPTKPAQVHVQGQPVKVVAHDS